MEKITQVITNQTNPNHSKNICFLRKTLQWWLYLREVNNSDIAIENFQFIIIEKGIKQNNINFFGVIGIGYVYEYIDKDSGLLDKILLNADFKSNC